MPVRQQVRLSESETANIPRMAPIGEVLTLTLGAGLDCGTVSSISVADTMVCEYIPRDQKSAYLAKTRLLLAKKCQARNSGLISYPPLGVIKIQN